MAVAYVGLACLLSIAFWRYWMPPQRSQISSNCLGKISAPRFRVRPVSSRFSSHISISSLPAQMRQQRITMSLSELLLQPLFLKYIAILIDLRTFKTWFSSPRIEICLINSPEKKFVLHQRPFQNVPSLQLIKQIMSANKNATFPYTATDQLI